MKILPVGRFLRQFLVYTHNFYFPQNAMELTFLYNSSLDNIDLKGKAFAVCIVGEECQRSRKPINIQ